MHKKCLKIVFVFVFLMVPGGYLFASEVASVALGLNCVRNAFSYDLWTGQKESEFTYNQLPEQDLTNLNYLFQRMSRLQQALPQLADYLETATHDFITAVPNDAEVYFINRRNPIGAIPVLVAHSPKNCILVKVAWSRVPKAKALDKKIYQIFIHKYYWDRMDTKNKMLILGQLIFGQNFNSTSKKTNPNFYNMRRYFNALLHSDQFLYYSNEELKDIAFKAKSFFFVD